MTQVIDKLVSFEEDYSDPVEGTRLIVKHEHDIPDDYISALKRDKVDELHLPTGDFFRVATLPIGIVEQWDREGFDISNAPIKDILARLRKHDVDAFITTNKRV
jgi:hypothetical protein